MFIIRHREPRRGRATPFAGTGLALAAALGSGVGCASSSWDGAGEVPVRVRVRDALTDRPVAGATVSQPSNASPDRWRRVLTDDAGRAEIHPLVGMGGTRVGVIKTTDVHPAGIRLRVERDGYVPADVPASDDPGIVTATEVFGIGGRPSFNRDVRLTPVDRSARGE